MLLFQILYECSEQYWIPSDRHIEQPRAQTCPLVADETGRRPSFLRRWYKDIIAKMTENSA
jgi:hypothetical protein